ncbi:SGNH/GDSL hydrolase family protein [Fredinandcohnia sp. QZ13]|uniref:SGNH/GDSL hydrolase family protein n=1 Tax=Fredinandcohnia sp. QZ13 TaxID=3073144 RepID=UPI0028534F3B|nr:SGNH/GDSL hydrolase family protein [Fredinandcohnia sp. QZ13]MDR4890083.1 SGNH/GDSL hydrolase family protein [Fredinandcohnia sp. QZ13]
MQDEIRWYSPKEKPFRISGFAWFNKEERYRRLPAKPVYDIPPRVDELADNTSGGQICFRTNATKLEIKVKLTDAANMGHMTASGQCGFDVYVGDPGKQQYYATAIPSLLEQSYEKTIWDFSSRSQHITEQFREVTLNFPLYQGVEEVLIGTNSSAIIEPPTPYDSDKRVIFYGTSITQGACASRPGMSYTNILSRRMNLEFINLGFSGSGRGEHGVALTIREIERPACFVLDYEANVTYKEYKDTLIPFIETYREYHPDVPIIIVSRIPFVQDKAIGEYEDYQNRREYSKSTVEKLQQQGDKNISFIDGANLLGELWHECTVDGIHPNDLGFMEMANRMENEFVFLRNLK